VVYLHSGGQPAHPVPLVPFKLIPVLYRTAWININGCKLEFENGPAYATGAESLIHREAVEGRPVHH